MKCSCGFILVLGANYCSECGLPALPPLSCKICKTDYASQKSKYCDECGSKRPEAKKRKTPDHVSLMDNLEHIKQLGEWMQIYPRRIKRLLQSSTTFEDIKSHISEQVRDRIQWISTLDVGRFLTLKNFSLFRRCCKSTLSWKQSTSWKHFVIGKHTLTEFRKFLFEKQPIPTVHIEYGKQSQKPIIDDFFQHHLFSIRALHIDRKYSGAVPLSLMAPTTFENINELGYDSNVSVDIIDAFLKLNSDKKTLRLWWGFQNRDREGDGTIYISTLRAFFSYSVLPTSYFVEHYLGEFGCKIRKWGDLTRIWRTICVKTEILHLDLHIGMNDPYDGFESSFLESGISLVRSIHVVIPSEKGCIISNEICNAFTLINFCCLCSPDLTTLGLSCDSKIKPNKQDYAMLHESITTIILNGKKQKTKKLRTGLKKT
jgi:hypothetical protein